MCGFAQTILGFEQICYALEQGDEEEQQRGEWDLCEPFRKFAGLSQDAVKPEQHSWTLLQGLTPFWGNKMITVM